MTKEEILKLISSLPPEEQKWLAVNIKPPKVRNVELFNKARNRFCDVYRELKRDTYCWSAKDSGALMQLCNKIVIQMREQGATINNDTICMTLELFLRESYKIDKWIANHYELVQLNSQFNILYNRMHHGEEGNRSISRDYLETVLRGC
jgi:hypothetical protein